MRAFIILLLFVPSLALAAIGVIGNGASVTCGTSPTVMDDPSIEDKYTRFMLACVPKDGSSVFVGGEGVTVGTGIEVEPGACFRTGTLAPNAKVYCVASSPSVIRVQESR